MLIAGCATNHEERATRPKRGEGKFSLLTTNAPSGSIYDLRVYVIKAGDSFYKIGKEHQVSYRELVALNPQLDPVRLQIGQQIRISERKRE